MLPSSLSECASSLVSPLVSPHPNPAVGVAFSFLHSFTSFLCPSKNGGNWVFFLAIVQGCAHRALKPHKILCPCLYIYNIFSDSAANSRPHSAYLRSSQSGARLRSSSTPRKHVPRTAYLTRRCNQATPSHICAIIVKRGNVICVCPTYPASSDATTAKPADDIASVELVLGQDQSISGCARLLLCNGRVKWNLDFLTNTF